MDTRHFRGVLEDNSRYALEGRPLDAGIVLIMLMYDKGKPFTLTDVLFS